MDVYKNGRTLLTFADNLHIRVEMISVRLARAGDIRVLVKFTVKLALETEGCHQDETVAEEGLRTLLVADPAKGLIYVAVDGEEEVVGCCLVTYEWSDWRNGVVWWLQGIYVMEDRRKQGVFKLIYEHIKDVVDKDSSIKGIRLFVDATNVIAQKAYTAMGMNGNHYKVFEYMK